MCKEENQSSKKLFHKVMRSLIMPVDREMNDFLTCSDIAEFLANLKKMKETDFTQETRLSIEKASIGL